VILFIVICGGLWFLGRAMNAPVAARWQMIGLVYLSFLAINIALPQGNGLRNATGGSPQLWLLLGGFAALAWGFSRLLGKLRARAQAVEAERAPTAPAPDQMSASELDRYSRHILLREIGGTGQRRLKNARVLVVGAGGLGAPVLQYLGAAGVGTIGVIDGDVVENSNLQRQVIHRDDMLGRPKVFSAQAVMEAQNPYVEVRPYNRLLTAEIVDDLIAEYDIVLDGCDDAATRYVVNAACVRAGKPLVSGALSQWEGQISVFDTAHGGPCYRCLFPEPAAAGLAPSCAEGGVVSALPGVIGAMMAVETIKLIVQAGAPLRGEMLIYDALWGETRKINLSRRVDCAECGGL
jgi:molybdopterin/thiamine biosynthesis adenylyltransferase